MTKVLSTMKWAGWRNFTWVPYDTFIADFFTRNAQTVHIVFGVLTWRTKR